ncbi:hypothetical protein V5G24_23035 [Xanthobacter sp. VTT E-85241]|uniref:hypothetical protein n=1 Tax=Roseixanthobacter finlandensis TaxID=3119922 RepID=UPI003726B9C0
MKKYIAIAIMVTALGSAQAQEARYGADGYAAVGTAYRIVTATAISVNSGTTITDFTSDTIPAVYRLVCSQKCHINAPVGVVTPTVSVSSTPLSAETPEYFILDAKSKLAVTRNASDGTLSISKMKK